MCRGVGRSDYLAELKSRGVAIESFDVLSLKLRCRVTLMFLAHDGRQISIPTTKFPEEGPIAPSVIRSIEVQLGIRTRFFPYEWDSES